MIYAGCNAINSDNNSKQRLGRREDRDKETARLTGRQTEFSINNDEKEGAENILKK